MANPPPCIHRSAAALGPTDRGTYTLTGTVTVSGGTCVCEERRKGGERHTLTLCGFHFGSDAVVEIRGRDGRVEAPDVVGPVIGRCGSHGEEMEQGATEGGALPHPRTVKDEGHCAWFVCIFRCAHRLDFLWEEEEGYQQDAP